MGQLSLLVFMVMLVFAVWSTTGLIRHVFRLRHLGVNYEWLVTGFLTTWAFTLPMFRAYAIHRNRYVIPSITAAALSTGYFFIGSLMILPGPGDSFHNMISLFMVIVFVLTVGLLAELRSRNRGQTIPWLEIGLSCLMFILPFSLLLLYLFL